jgi:hypothetical protein
MPFIPMAMAQLGATMMVESTGVMGESGPGAAIGGVLGTNAADDQANAIREQTAQANRLAEETRAEKAKLESESKANTEKLAAAPGIAAEEARKEDMRRRKSQTRTLLTGSLGSTEEATTQKKTLLGG